MGLFILGLVVGAIIVAFLMWKVMPGMMIVTKQSNLSVDEAVKKIEEEAPKYGWSVPHKYDMDSTLSEKGYKGLRKVKILSLCKPEYAYTILSRERDRKMAAAMPCRIAVYEDDRGRVFVSEMNIRLMGKMFGGVVGDVMSKVAKEEEFILKGIVKG